MDVNSGFARQLKKSRIGRPVGVFAYRVATRLRRNSTAPKLMVNTLAKAGTHLVMSTLDSLPQYRFSGRHHTLSVLDLEEPLLSKSVSSLHRDLRRSPRGTYMTGHIAYHERVAELFESLKVKRVLVVRDPRALVVSTARYMRSYERHPLHATVNRMFPSDEELCRAVILGFQQDGGNRNWPSFRDRLNSFAGWLDDSESLTIRFEDLVGAEGGGDSEAQLATIAKLQEYLGIDLDSETRDRVAKSAFDTRAATFRSGEIDGWKRALSSKTLDLLHSECAPAALRIGYSLD